MTHAWNTAPRKTVRVLCLLTLIGALATPLLSHAQWIDSTRHVDGELWNSIRLDFELNKRWELKTDHQLRTKTYSTEIDRFQTEATLEYRPMDQLTLGAAGRYFLRNDNEGAVQGFEHLIRFHIEAEWTSDLDRLTVKQRFRYQHQNQLGQSREEGDYPQQAYRYKLSFDYDIPNWKWDPTIGAELFYQQERGEINGFRRFRLICGVEKKLPGPNKLDLGYMYEQQKDLWRPRMTHIAVVKFSHNFKRKKKKEEQPGTEG